MRHTNILGWIEIGGILFTVEIFVSWIEIQKI